jgi:hypothetical protein
MMQPIRSRDLRQTGSPGEVHKGTVAAAQPAARKNGLRSPVLPLTIAGLVVAAAGSVGAQEAPPASASAGASAATPSPRFSTSAKWEHAGYNSDEIVYTIVIDNQDPRILRCRTRMRGFYFNDGKRQTIEDIQVSVVFPGQQVPAGIWMDMDEASGATYEVSCKPT